jgi:hypothetical protein
MIEDSLPRDGNCAPISVGLCINCHLDPDIEHESVALYVFEGMSLCEMHVRKMYESLK